MTDSTPMPPPGWFPDPEGSPRQRYWDGVQWTGHYHPPVVDALAPPASSTLVAGAPPRTRRRGKVLAFVAAGVVVALAATSVVVFAVVPALSGGINGAIHDDPDWDYSYTDPMLDLEPDHVFEFPADYDLEALSTAEAKANPDPAFPDEEPLLSERFAFEVFYDAALSLHADVFVHQDDPGEPVTIDSNDSERADGGDLTSIISTRGEWGLHTEYFIVRKLDTDGSVLDKPVVTRFTVKSELATPAVTFGTPDADGNLSISWDPVEGATGYTVITSNFYDSTIGSRTYTALAETDQTSWSTDKSMVPYHYEAPFVTEQNSELKMYSGGSVDDIQAGWLGAGNTGEYDIGVVASDAGVFTSEGAEFSAYEPHNAREIAGLLPLQLAPNAMRDLLHWGPSGYIDGVENLQTSIRYTSLDGATRSAVAHVEPDEVTDGGLYWLLPVMGEGTSLGDWIPLSKASAPDVAAAVSDFNARAAAVAPTTGMLVATGESVPVDEFAAGTKKAPKTDYPVFGSTPFTTFLATHMIAQTGVIDISDYAGKPGVPDVMDAAMEAREQNPYVINVIAFTPSADGTRLTVAYDGNVDDARAIQKGIRTQVDAVVASVVTDGMTDRDKVSALNSWLTQNAEYNYAAVEAKEFTLGGIPIGFANAWNASGVLVDRIGVCASYAYAFHALAAAAGVESVVVTGPVLDGGLHAWDKVKIDGTWLAVDPTWNDSPRPDRFLMIRDADFTGGATRTEDTNWMTDLMIADYATP